MKRVLLLRAESPEIHFVGEARKRNVLAQSARLLLDTNSLLRLLLNDIPSQKKIVEELLQKAKAREVSILVPEIVIFELEFALNKYYSAPKNKVVEKLQIIMTINFIEIESKQIFATALGLYSAGARSPYPTQRISFVDCFIHAKAIIEKFELFTFDKKLSKLSS